MFEFRIHVHRSTVTCKEEELLYQSNLAFLQEDI
jgi:hypothetical protein